MNVDCFLPLARELALQAGRVVMSLAEAPLVQARKADRSLVTNADHAANDLIRKELRRSLPAHAVLSEETGFEGPTSARFVWLVDPLDGTRAYVRGTPGFSVMLGLVFDGEPVLGVVYDPTEDRLYEAAKGHGAFHTRKGERTALRVSARADLSAAPVVTSTGFPDALKEKLSPRFPGPWLPPVNSVGVKVGILARGEGDVYVNHHPVHIWDTAGPQAILEEAGGRMTLWDGAYLRYDLARTAHPGPTLATNAAVHAEASRILSSLKPPI